MDSESRLAQAIKSIKTLRDYQSCTKCCRSCANLRGQLAAERSEPRPEYGAPLYCGAGEFRFEVEPTGVCRSFSHC